MAFANYDTHKIHCKVVYFGCSGAGITSNLQKILEKTHPDIISGNYQRNNYLTSDKLSQGFFEFLPLDIGTINNHNFIVHLYSFPNESLFDSFDAVLLKGIDGLVFVIDSSIHMLPENIDYWQKTDQTLQKHGLLISDIPCVVQYNKRDLTDAVPTAILRQYVNKLSLPDIEANALTGKGVLESLSLVIEQFIEKINCE